MHLFVVRDALRIASDACQWFELFRAVVTNGVTCFGVMVTTYTDDAPCAWLLQDGVTELDLSTVASPGRPSRCRGRPVIQHCCISLSHSIDLNVADLGSFVPDMATTAVSYRFGPFGTYCPTGHTCSQSPPPKPSSS